MRRIVSRSAAEKEPHLVWNAFIDLIAAEGYEEMSETQRRAHLVFWYDSEVQNGGHDQYFENCGTERLGEVLAALRAFDLPCQAEVLQSAAAARSEGRVLSEMDAAYHRCLPSTIEGLERHLEGHQVEYVDLR